MVDGNDERREGRQLRVGILGIAEDDDDVTGLRQPCRGAVDLQLTGPSLAWDRIGLKARAVVDVDDMHRFKLANIRACHEIRINRKRADIVEVACSDCGAVDLALEKRTSHSWSSVEGLPGGRSGNERRITEDSDAIEVMLVMLSMTSAGVGRDRARSRREIRRPRPAARRAHVGSALISGACAVGFVLWARHQRLPHMPGDLGSRLAILLGVMAYAVATVGLCERWSFLLRRQACTLSRFVGYRPALVGQLGNMFLPARVGDALRVGLVAAMNEEISTVTVLGTVVAERALDIGCQVVLLVVVVSGLFGPSFDVLGRGPSIVAGLGLMVCAVSVAFVLGNRVSSRVSAMSKRAKILVPFFAPLVGLRRESRVPILVSVIMWTSEIVGWWAAAHAVGLSLNLLQAAYVFAVASLALIAPVGFGAIGTLDAGIVFSIKTIGVSTTPALSFVLLLRVLFVLPSLVVMTGIAFASQARLLRERQMSLWKLLKVS